MAWTTPTIRATGYLVTSSDWNTDIVNNLAYLKGEAGVDIEFEDDVVPSAGTERVGLFANPWAEGHFDKLYAGPRCALHKFIREQIIVWETDNITDIQGQIGLGMGANGDVSMGGTGQIRLEIEDDTAGSNAYLYNKPEANNAKDTSFNASRSPYARFEFNLDAKKALQDIYFGFRTTVSGSVLAHPEKWAVIAWNGAQWSAWSDDGTTSETTVIASPTDNVRHVVEILIVSATSVEFYVDGVLVATHTTKLPTGDLDWTVLMVGDGSGGFGVKSRVTVGALLFQEDLS